MAPDTSSTASAARARLALALAAGLVVAAASPAPAGPPLLCSQPLTTGERPTATDCLFILRAAVGAAVCDSVCVCAPKGSLPPSATDALICLTSAVGQETVLACPCGPVFLQGVLPRTTGRFNYNLVIGVPGSDAACETSFPGTHTCTLAELAAAEDAGDLAGVQDTGGATVTSFWAIDPTRPDDVQCTVSTAWDYQTAHTGQSAERVDLDNAAGTLGPVAPAGCGSRSWVGCCQ